jgi:hypothetical protein
VAPVGLTEQEWNAKHGCTHAHCPCGCEHPQPFMADGVLICGRCAIKFGERCVMVPCVPPGCLEHGAAIP